MGLLDFLKPKETRVKELVNELYRKGWNLEAEKKYEEAVQVYDQVINLNPQYVSVHISKGDALRKMKKYEEAIRTYNKANGIKQDGDAYAGIGFALMGLDRYEEAIEYFRDSNSAYIEKSDDDFWADYEADRDDYAPGALEAHFKNHSICGGYEIEKFHELMEKKCEQLVNAGKYREAIKVAYDGLHVVDTPWESYYRYVNRSLEAMGKDVMADKLRDKHNEAEDASRWGENDKAGDKMRSAVWHVKNQLNIKNESYHIIIDYPDDPVIPSTTPRASDFSSQLPKIIKRHAPKLVIGTIIFFVVFGILSLIDWNNNDSENTHQNILPAPISIASAKLAPVIEWQKCLGGSDIDQALSVQQTSDGGYIVGGRSNSIDGDVTGNHGDYDAWIVKLDTIGNMEWQKSLGGSDNDGASSIQQTFDGGYIVAGYSVSNDGDVTGNHGKGDCWIVKLDKRGNIEWQKSLGGSGLDAANSIQQTSDGGYIVCGRSNSTDGDVTGNHGGYDPWVVKLSTSGNIEWQKCLGSSGFDEGASSVQQTSDGGYIVAGTTTSNDGDVTGNHGDMDSWVVKPDTSGNIEWQKSLGGSGSDVAGSIQQTSDGGYVFAGRSTSNDSDVTGNHGGLDLWIVKLDTSGNIEWQRCLGGPDGEVALSVQQTSDGEYIVAGDFYSSGGDVDGNHGSRDYWVVKLDTRGKIVWQKFLGGSSSDTANSINQTSDGDYIVAGDSFSNNGDVTGNHDVAGNQGYPDLWVIKLRREEV